MCAQPFIMAEDAECSPRAASPEGLADSDDGGDGAAGEATDGVMKKPAGKRPQQRCVNYENYLSETDWALLRRNVSKQARVQILAKRAAAIGLRSPCQYTLKRMVGGSTKVHARELHGYLYDRPQADKEEEEEEEEEEGGRGCGGGGGGGG